MKLDCHTMLRAPFRFMIKASKVLAWRRQSWFEHNTGRHRPLGVKALRQTKANFSFCFRPKWVFSLLCTRENHRKSRFEAWPIVSTLQINVCTTGLSTVTKGQCDGSSTNDDISPLVPSFVRDWPPLTALAWAAFSSILKGAYTFSVFQTSPRPGASVGKPEVVFRTLFSRWGN